MGSLVQIQSPRPFLSSMPLLLLTNDDGVHAPGLTALEQALAELGDAYVLAPEREQSACGHALTLHRPLRVDRLGERRFAVNGTPSDCVNLGVLGFLAQRPWLVVAGVNHGPNLGDDGTYSGTVSAAMEGTLLGVPSIAVSLAPNGDLAVAAEVARLIALRVLVAGLPKKTLLNVNVPAAPRGIRLTRLGHRVYREKIVEQTDPRGRTLYSNGAGAPQSAGQIQPQVPTSSRPGRSSTSSPGVRRRSRSAPAPATRRPCSPSWRAACARSSGCRASPNVPARSSSSSATRTCGSASAAGRSAGPTRRRSTGSWSPPAAPPCRRRSSSSSPRAGGWWCRSETPRTRCSPWSRRSVER